MGLTGMKGPFELLFEYGLDNYIDRLREEDIEIPNLFSTMSRLKTTAIRLFLISGIHA